MDWLREHSLTLVLLAIMATSLVYSLAVDAEGKDIASNVFGDTWGAFLIVRCDKMGPRAGPPTTPTFIGTLKSTRFSPQITNSGSSCDRTFVCQWRTLLA